MNQLRKPQVNEPWLQRVFGAVTAVAVVVLCAADAGLYSKLVTAEVMQFAASADIHRLREDMQAQNQKLRADLVKEIESRVAIRISRANIAEAAAGGPRLQFDTDPPPPSGSVPR